MNQVLEFVIAYAFKFIKVPYKWGGNTPISGFDCSGLICEILKAFDILHRGEDLSANDLYWRLTKSFGPAPYTERGVILFFGTSIEQITHVAIAISDKFMIEAGGGDSTTVNLKMAEMKNAFVRIRPVRRDLVGRVMPRYGG